MNSDKEGLVQAWGGRSRQREQPPSQMRLPGLSPVGFTGRGVKEQRLGICVLERLLESVFMGRTVS